MTDELNERFSPKQIKQAIGIASDKRYAGGNMTGATKTIEKLARGLSDHPQVRAVLKRQNEELEEARPPQIKKGKAKGSISATGMRGKGNKKYDVMVGFDNGKFSFRITDESGRFQTVGIKQASKMLGEESVADLVSEKFDPADFDMVATDKDKAGAKMNIIMQLRKAADVRGNIPIQFADGKKAKLPPKVIELALKKFASFRKPDSKEKLQTAMGKSYKDMVHALKTMREEVELDEARRPAGHDKTTFKGVPFKDADAFEKLIQSVGQFKITSKGTPKGTDFIVTGPRASMDKLEKALRSNKRFNESVKESIEEGVDKAKIQKQIDQAEKYLKTFFGNTSSVKMKKVAIQRKIDKLKKQLNEAEEDAKEDYCDCGCECGKEICESCGKPHKPENIKECVNEEVQQDLQEAPNYKLYHNTFSGAVQEAIAVAKKKGFDVDEDDWHDKVATGPKKPSKDKTNSYSIKLMKKGKPVRQMLQIQVYNMGAKYELNCYVQ
jgi:hypothetical protein